MTDQEQRPKLRKKQKRGGPEVEFRLGATFEVDKDTDWDLNLKEMQYTAKSGQAGTRCKATNFDGAGGDQDAARASD